MNIRAYTETDLDALTDLTILAWTPVFPLMEKAYLPAVYKAFYPNGWEIAQNDALKTTVSDKDVTTWVAEEDGTLTGFACAKLRLDDMMGEVYMIATHPDHQGKGIGQALIQQAEEWMKQNDMKIVLIETGADEGHAPARNTYEKAGYSLTPIARYFKEL